MTVHRQLDSPTVHGHLTRKEINHIIERLPHCLQTICNHRNPDCHAVCRQFVIFFSCADLSNSCHIKLQWRNRLARQTADLRIVSSMLTYSNTFYVIPFMAEVPVSRTFAQVLECYFKVAQREI